MEKNLYIATKNIWDENKCDVLSARWAQELENAKTQAEDLSRFNQWSPLKIYTSLSKARKIIPSFSVRYQGQEVAELIADHSPSLSISPTHEKNNLKCFGLVTKSNVISWRSPEATTFRKQFKSLHASPSKPMSMKSDEAWLQSLIFEKMVKSGEDGFHACLPVLFDRFPFQCPIPISASTGLPKATKGNLDILARRGQGGTHPAIWELKKPKTCGTALEQAYIYGVTLALMLRNDGGQKWFRSFGFRSKLNIDRLLKIDIIIAITRDRESELNNHLQAFDSPLLLSKENVQLRPYVAYYDWDKMKGTVNIDAPIDLSKRIRGI
jgi:hypothetical protein